MKVYITRLSNRRPSNPGYSANESGFQEVNLREGPVPPVSVALGEIQVAINVGESSIKLFGTARTFLTGLQNHFQLTPNLETTTMTTVTPYRTTEPTLIKSGFITYKESGEPGVLTREVNLQSGVFFSETYTLNLFQGRSEDVVTLADCEIFPATVTALLNGTEEISIPKPKTEISVLTGGSWSVKIDIESPDGKLKSMTPLSYTYGKKFSYLKIKNIIFTSIENLPNDVKTTFLQIFLQNNAASAMSKLSSETYARNLKDFLNQVVKQTVYTYVPVNLVVNFHKDYLATIKRTIKDTKTLVSDWSRFCERDTHSTSFDWFWLCSYTDKAPFQPEYSVEDLQTFNEQLNALNKKISHLLDPGMPRSFCREVQTQASDTLNSDVIIRSLRETRDLSLTEGVSSADAGPSRVSGEDVSGLPQPEQPLSEDDQLNLIIETNLKLFRETQLNQLNNYKETIKQVKDLKQKAILLLKYLQYHSTSLTRIE